MEEATVEPAVNLCDYSFGGERCNALADHYFSAEMVKGRRIEGHGHLCAEHYAFVRDAAMPLEAQFGKEIDACKALKATTKRPAKAKAPDFPALTAEIERLRAQLAEKTAAPVSPGLTIHAEPAETGIPVTGQYPREAVERACRRLLADVAAYKGKGISPVLWGAAIYRVSKGQPVSEKQYVAICAIAARQPEKYSALFAA